MAGKSPATQNRTESIELRRKEVERPQTSQQEQQRECYVRHCAFFVEVNISLLPQDRLLTSLARTAACMSAAVGPGHGCWNTLLVTKPNLSRPTWNSIFHFLYPSLFCFFFFFSEEKQLYFLGKLLFSPQSAFILPRKYLLLNHSNWNFPLCWVELSKLQSSKLQICLVTAGSEYRFQSSIFLENQTFNEDLSYNIWQRI